MLPTGRVLNFNDMKDHHGGGPTVLEFSRQILRSRREQITIGPVLDSAPIEAHVRAFYDRITGAWLARWLARCECGGWEDVTPADPVHFCLSCYNREAGNRLRPVVFPAQREEVESLLMERDDGPRRNYDHGETVAELRQQNADLQRVARRARRPMEG